MHLHCEDTMGNKNTIRCHLTDSGSISWKMMGGWGSSGMAFSMSNISFYERTPGGNMDWNSGKGLPIENLEGETLKEFKNRSLEALRDSTVNVIKEVNCEVKFAEE